MMNDDGMSFSAASHPMLDALISGLVSETYLKPMGADSPLEIADDSCSPHLGLVHDDISRSFDEVGVGGEAFR
jgi:hypothetical protein